MRHYKPYLLSLLLSLYAAISFGQTNPALTDTILPRQYADLSIRFRHLEPLVNDKTLIAAWPMDEGSGYEFLDASGKNHTAYITGYNWNTTSSGLTASFRKKGKRNGGVYLDGSQWLQVKDTSDLQLKNQFSIYFWYKHVGDKGGTLISQRGAQGGYKIICDNQGAIIFALIDERGKSNQMVASNIGGDKSDWQFVALTYQHKTLTIFINGKPVVSKSNFSLDNNIKQDLYIGADHQNTNSCFKGYVDEVCIYSQPLNPARLEQLYLVGLPKVYTQTKATVAMGSDYQHWSGFYGNQPVPHIRDNNTLLLVHFNGNTITDNGQTPDGSSNQHFIPSAFGAALIPDRQLTYKAALDNKKGIAEAWIMIRDEKSTGHKTLLNLPGVNNPGLEIYRAGNNYGVDIHDGKKIISIKSGYLHLSAGELLHVAVLWGKANIELWINGVRVAQSHTDMAQFNGDVQVGGGGKQLFTDAIDDLKIADSISDSCPFGSIDSESASLDFRDDFEQPERSPLFFWKTVKGSNSWAYQKDNIIKDNTVLSQQNPDGMQLIMHPGAFAAISSIETGVVFNSLSDSWAGVGINMDNRDDELRGITFCINSKTRELRLNVYEHDKVVAAKTGIYDFPVKVNQRYTLTLSFYGDVVKGFIDGNPVIAMPVNFKFAGCGGLVTENTTACFDDVHFSPLTPSEKNSRLLQTRIFSDTNQQDSIQASYKNFSYNAFRWKKRYGLLPWQRTFKNPEPAGNIFGQDAGVARPNKSQSWRSEDAANSDLMMLNGTIYYAMRGNPDMNGPHGPAAIGMLTAGQQNFDGLHFTDLNADSLNDKKIGLLAGHPEAAVNCVDNAPRNQRLQVNDEGMVYANGKIFVVAREFRNAVKDYPKFRRLVYGTFNIAQNRWDANVVSAVPWSVMDPANCQDKLKGLNGTPDLSGIIDPATGRQVILMYYEDRGKGMVTGLKFDGKTLQLDTAYPPRPTITKSDGDRTYGQRVFFDNGIYYMNVNAGSDAEKLQKDWPDRFQLFASLDPYSSPWIASGDNDKARPYFTRGNATDPDNGAIWQGTIFKYRNRYYMYYENYHSVNNVNNPYDQYDKVNPGSRVGFATGN